MEEKDNLTPSSPGKRREAPSNQMTSRPSTSCLTPCRARGQACGTDNGYPNVRLAEKLDEVQALERRLHDAGVSVSARNCKDLWDRFGIAVANSKAIISRPLALVQEIFESDRRTYTGYHRQLASGARVAEENKFDRIRTQVEAALFPNFYSEMIFGFISIGNATLKGYGAYPTLSA